MSSLTEQCARYAFQAQFAVFLQRMFYDKWETQKQYEKYFMQLNFSLVYLMRLFPVRY